MLDPNVHGNLTIVLDDVPWDQALDIVLKNNDLSRNWKATFCASPPSTHCKKEAEDGAPRTMPKLWRSTKSQSPAS